MKLKLSRLMPRLYSCPLGIDVPRLAWFRDWLEWDANFPCCDTRQNLVPKSNWLSAGYAILIWALHMCHHIWHNRALVVRGKYNNATRCLPVLGTKATFGVWRYSKKILVAILWQYHTPMPIAISHQVTVYKCTCWQCKLPIFLSFSHCLFHSVWMNFVGHAGTAPKRLAGIDYIIWLQIN